MSRDAARLTTWVRDAVTGAGARWLPAQRWFGGKSRQIAAVTLDELIWLPVPERIALCVLAVRYADADPGGTTASECYASLVAVSDETGARAIAPVHGHTLSVVDATAEPAAVRALLATLRASRVVAGERGGQLIARVATDADPDVRTLGSDAREVSALGAEQSNTSVRIDRRHMVKVFRRLQDGVHPEVEMGGFLARAGFPATPPLEAHLVYRRADQAEFAVAVVEGWIENEGDGWSYVVESLARANGETAGEAPLIASLETLGTLTADLHVTLASATEDPAFAPEPIGQEDRERWRAQITAQAQRSFEAMAREARAWSGDAAGLAQEALARRGTVDHRLRVLDREAPAGSRKIRVHGDLHLGQTLKRPRGFAIIDFEGEPLAPLDVRREKHCALRDVAGMLRSIEYAVATARRRHREVASIPGALVLRRAFLDAYRAGAARAPAPFLPAAARAFDAWLDVFELEKAFYELEYEVNNRPDWAAIPLGGIVALLSRAAA